MKLIKWVLLSLYVLLLTGCIQVRIVNSFSSATPITALAQAPSVNTPDVSATKKAEEAKIAEAGSETLAALPTPSPPNGGQVAVLSTATNTIANRPTQTDTPQPTHIKTKPPKPTFTPTPSGRTYFNRGVPLIGQGKFEEAIEQFNLALSYGFETAELYQQRGWACHEWQHYKKQCSYEKAISDLSKAIALDPTKALYYHRRAWSYTGIQKLDLALDDWEKAVGLAPDNAEYWREIGWRSKELRNYAKAIEAFSKAIELSGDVWAYIGRGAVYNEHFRDNEKALPDFNKAVENGPSDPNPYFHRGIYFGQHEQWDELINDMTKAISFAPEWPDLYGHRGDAYKQLGQIAKTRTDYLKFLQVTEGNSGYTGWRSEVKRWLKENPE